MANWLQNEYVIVSGASGGIGKELTKLLVQKYGAKVVGIGRSEEKMLRLKEELGNTDRFTYRLFDVGDKSSWQALQRELTERAIYPILLVNNAGVFPPLARVTNTPSDVVEATTKNNFISAAYAIEAFPTYSKENELFPAVVNICSSAALCPVVGSAAYSASKGALKGYTEALQLEEKGKRYIGIVYPGTTATELFRDDGNVQNSAMHKIAASPYKMAKKIARKIYRRRKRAVLGFDAKLMSFLTRMMPVKGPALIRRIMKISKSKAFDNVFKD